jgi:hypothetical protein
MGQETEAIGDRSTAMGRNTKAIGDYSTAMGTNTLARGNYSTTMGGGTLARANYSVVIGRLNDTSATSSPSTWVDTDPLFIIGNGSDYDNRHNAVLVNKNGEVYFPDVYGDEVGTTNLDLYIDDSGKIGYVTSSLRYKRKINTMEDISWLYQLRPVNFIYKNDKSETNQYGLIAEEVEKINPLFVSYNQEGQVETVHYSKLVTPMIKALQEHEKKILEQQNIIENQQSRIDRLEELVDKILESSEPEP